MDDRFSFSPASRVISEWLRFFGILLLLCSCDRSMPAEINFNKVYEITTPCGNIELKANYFAGSVTVAQKFTGSGYMINPDLLRLETVPKDVIKIERIEFRDVKGNVLPPEQIDINGDKTLLVTVFTKMESDSTTGGRYLSILPSDYLMCNNKPVITDALQIKY